MPEVWSLVSTINILYCGGTFKRGNLLGGEQVTIGLEGLLMLASESRLGFTEVDSFL